MRALRPVARCQAGRGPEPTVAVIDSQSVKTTDSGRHRGYDAGKKIKFRKRHITVETEGLLIAAHVQPADIQDRDGAPDVILAMLETEPTVMKLFTDSGYRGPKLRRLPKERVLSDLIVIVEKPKDIKAFNVLCRRWVVERSFAWMCRCRRLAKDFERTIESSVACVNRTAFRFMMRWIARTKPIA